jgi:hypothetical protein
VKLPSLSKDEQGVIKGRAVVILIAVALFVLRIPFYMTGDVQEDAYIIFRTSINLVEFGSYSYNVGLPDVGITCHAYALGVALVRVVAHDYFIPVVLSINTFLVIGGIYFIAASIEDKFIPRMVVWAFASLLPAAIGISILGMETAMLLFVVGLALHEAVRKNDSVGLFSFLLFLLPWIRPDAIAYGLILYAAYVLSRKRFSVPPFAALVMGCVSLAVFNWLTTGHWVNQTVIAKAMAYHVDKSPGAVFARFVEVFFTKSIFLPLGKASFRYPALFFGVLTLFLIGLSIWRNRSNRPLWIAYGCLGTFALVIPLPYIWEGAFFPWYFQISSLAGGIVLLAMVTDLVLERLFAFRKAALALAALMMVLIICLYYASDVMAGAECQQAEDIGRYIHEISKPGDTLFLEPAGYIPYFAKVKTYEEVGISSSLVLQYRLKYGDLWWMRFLKEQRPTLLYQRSHIRKHMNLFGYEMTPDEAAWFDQNYEMVKEFQYNPRDYVHSRWILRATGMLNFQPPQPTYVFRLRGS